MVNTKVAWILPKEKKNRTAFCIAALLVVFILMAGCSSSEDSNRSESKGSPNEAGSPAANSEGAFSYEENESFSLLSNVDQAGKALQNEAADQESATVTAGGAVPISAATHGKIIYTANLTLEVEELSKAAPKLRDVIHLNGGYILQFNDTRYDGEIGANYTIRVPAGDFMAFIDAISQIENKHFGQSLSGKDVTEQYVDLESRLKARQLVEGRLLEMMEKATKADDLIQFSNKLGAVQEEIEGIKGKIRYLDNHVAFSTIELRMVQTNQSMPSKLEEKEKGFGAQLSDALSGSVKVVVEALKLILIVLVGALPVAAIAVIIGIPVYMLVKSRRRRPIPVRNHMIEQKADESDKES